MGTIPSRDAPATFFSLRYGTHEVGLIPLTRRYFHSENKVLRQQFIRMRNDPSIRYHFMRGPKYDMRTLPPADYSEEHLNSLLNAIDETLYDTTAAMLADRDAPIRPVPCAICFVYVNGREGSDCFSFYGRRINIIGYFSCRENEIGKDTEPYLHFRKAILKAAGDRTLERVIALSVAVLKKEFFRAVVRTCPNEDPLELFKQRIKKIPVVVSTLWNSYPTLKFLYDSCALSWAIEPLQVMNDPPSFEVYAVSETGEKGLKITLSGALVLRMIMWVSSLLLPSSIRGSWEQLVLNEGRTQLKGKTMSKWLETSVFKSNCMGSEELTTQVSKHLSTLLGEIVRAREIPLEDLTLWRQEQEYSHDGKLYRIFDSPLCGPFLTTVKARNSVDKKIESNGDRKGTSVQNVQQTRSDDVDKQNSPPLDTLLGSTFHDNQNITIASTNATLPHPPPPQYSAPINPHAPALFVNAPTAALASPGLGVPVNYSAAPPFVPGPLPVMVLPSKAPGSAQSGAATFVPIFHQPEASPAGPLETAGGPFVVLGQAPPSPVVMGGGENFCGVASEACRSETYFAQNACPGNAGVCVGGLKLVGTLQPPQVPSYVVLPDGRIGMLNAAMAEPAGYWN